MRLQHDLYGPAQCKLIVAAIALALSPLAHAALLGGNISAGTGTIDQTATTTTITQQTQHLAIDWQSFNIGSSEAVNFIQPDVSSIALNRVLGQDASSILGSLTSNGQVFILNPNGVLFGTTAQVSVGGLVASTLDISDADFIAGNYHFSTGGTTGNVTNQGTLNAADGGYIALLAPHVVNDGTITATSGTALMAAGDQVTLDLNNGSLLSFTIDQGSFNALAENKQLIRADGGQVILTAQAADALSSAVVNNSGIIEARTVQNVSGVIRLLGDMNVGWVNVGGTLDAGATGPIVISGAHVSIDSAQLNGGISLINSGDYTVTDSVLNISLTNNSVLYSSTSGLTSGSITGDFIVGGLVGYNTVGTISNSYVSGGVVSNSSSVGGLVGTNSGSITNSYVTGSVSGSGSVGVLVGSISNPPTVANGVGALVGSNAGNLSASYSVIDWQIFSISSTEITNFYQAGITGGNAVLNHINSGSVGIIGILNADNGQVFLTNPNGIIVSGSLQQLSGTLVIAKSLSIPAPSVSALASINAGFSPLSLANHPNPALHGMMPNDFPQPAVLTNLVQNGIRLPDGMFGQ